MKARIPLSVKQQKHLQSEAERYIKAEWDKVQHNAVKQMVRRTLKIACVALHEVDGFGVQRLERFVNECGRITAQVDTDPIIWEHIDQLLIDRYGMKWGERDYTENDKDFYGVNKNGK